MHYDWMRSAVAAILSIFVCSQAQAGPGPQTRPAWRAGLRIKVVAGQNAANSLKSKTATPLVIEVRDANDRPVPAVRVHLSTPLDQAGVIFGNGSRSITVVTETDGRASVSDMTPEGPGIFDITVEASTFDEFANTTITQCNSENGLIRPGMAGSVALGKSGAAKKHTSKAVVFGVVAGVAVAVGVGLAVGLRNSGHSSSTSTSGIGVGTPTVGAP